MSKASSNGEAALRVADPNRKGRCDALLLAGHGSRDEDAGREFAALVERLRRYLPGMPVDYGFLEFARPTISEAAERLLVSKPRRVAVLPGMLMAARHMKNDIPSEIHLIQRRFPGSEFIFGADLGINAHLLQLARKRIEAAEKQAPSDYRRDQALLLVIGRGTSDSDANSNITKVTRMLWEGMGFGWAETGYTGVTAPLVPDALKRIAGLGMRDIVVFPWFLFDGRLLKHKIRGGCRKFQQANRQFRLFEAEHFNDHEQTALAFLDRLRDIEQGTGNMMNCQLCKYREQIVGYEDEVGMPQAGHHHHVRGIGTDSSHGHDHHGHSHGHHRVHSHDHRQGHSPASGGVENKGSGRREGRR